ncbi:uncharacterized protein PGTG_09008 [Puccinia graminis f. sp. tritici CRL 75-36-700-3]|uniref:Uncharacterized protein n=1 Tax=Puccinia graminis f. sp. tritici (strain CRL 75-36-700-3 / race SCCL) TaxID=418459 RepID=E3KE74_PUCGT|nr:uncharacterized protein PGTG_09008 [Puccinia graminis f. sp. tritici CRL 75-36-700-3]EFP82812.1 hypothetical protein PGTG_09008 [Puccinia graminis f. sp. tritici CRL 75-36-700-3]
MPDGLVKAGRWMDGLTLQEFGKVLPNEACKQRNMFGLLLESHDQRRLRSSGGPLTLKSLQHSSSPSSPIAKIHVLHIEMYPLGFPLLSAFACHLPVEAPLSLSLLVGNENLLASDIQWNKVDPDNPIGYMSWKSAIDQLPAPKSSFLSTSSSSGDWTAGPAHFASQVCDSHTQP